MILTIHIMVGKMWQCWGYFVLFLSIEGGPPENQMSNSGSLGMGEIRHMRRGG